MRRDDLAFADGRSGFAKRRMRRLAIARLIALLDGDTPRREIDDFAKMAC